MRASPPAALIAALSLMPGVGRADERATLAQQRYVRGIALYNEGSFAPALGEFRAALELYASPNPRLYVARCERGLGQLAEAVAEYTQTVQEADDRARLDPRYAETRDAAASELRALEARVARVQVRAIASANARVEIAGRSLPAAVLGLPVVVLPGRVRVRVVEFDGSEAVGEVTVAAGETRELVLGPRAPAPSLAVRRPPAAVGPAVAVPSEARGTIAWPLAWGAAAVGVAGFGTAAVFGALTADRFAMVQTRCAERCSGTQVDWIETGERYQLVTNSALGVGIVGAVVAVGGFVVAALTSRPVAVRSHASFGAAGAEVGVSF